MTRKKLLIGIAIAAVLGSFAAGYAVTELVNGPRANRPHIEDTSAAGRTPDQGTTRRDDPTAP